MTGELGGSLAGRHLRFEPRLEEGLWLREYGWAGAMIDISDGLATDLGHILESSGVGAEIEAKAVPVSAAARRSRGKRKPLDRALFDGEDFELLFTVAADRESAFRSSWQDTFRLRCTRIGRVTACKGRLLQRRVRARSELRNAGLNTAAARNRSGGLRSGLTHREKTAHSALGRQDIRTHET